MTSSLDLGISIRKSVKLKLPDGERCKLQNDSFESNTEQALGVKDCCYIWNEAKRTDMMTDLGDCFVKTALEMVNRLRSDRLSNKEKSAIINFLCGSGALEMQISTSLLKEEIEDEKDQSTSLLAQDKGSLTVQETAPTLLTSRVVPPNSMQNQRHSPRKPLTCQKLSRTPVSMKSTNLPPTPRYVPSAAMYVPSRSNQNETSDVVVISEPSPNLSTTQEPCPVTVRQRLIDSPSTQNMSRPITSNLNPLTQQNRANCVTSSTISDCLTSQGITRPNNSNALTQQRITTATSMATSMQNNTVGIFPQKISSVTMVPNISDPSTSQRISKVPTVSRNSHPLTSEEITNTETSPHELDTTTSQNFTNVSPNEENSMARTEEISQNINARMVPNSSTVTNTNSRIVTASSLSTTHGQTDSSDVEDQPEEGVSCYKTQQEGDHEVIVKVERNEENNACTTSEETPRMFGNEDAQYPENGQEVSRISHSMETDSESFLYAGNNGTQQHMLSRNEDMHFPENSRKRQRKAQPSKIEKNAYVRKSCEMEDTLSPPRNSSLDMNVLNQQNMLGQPNRTKGTSNSEITFVESVCVPQNSTFRDSQLEETVSAIGFPSTSSFVLPGNRPIGIHVPNKFNMPEKRTNSIASSQDIVFGTAEGASVAMDAASMLDNDSAVAMDAGDYNQMSAKPYQCKYCSKSFKCSDHLRSHTRIHTGEKPYACPFCPSRFRTTSNINTHMRIHTGERPHTCSICGRGFKRSTELNRHMYTHSQHPPPPPQM